MRDLYFGRTSADLLDVGALRLMEDDYIFEKFLDLIKWVRRNQFVIDACLMS